MEQSLQIQKKPNLKKNTTFFRSSTKDISKSKKLQFQTRSSEESEEDDEFEKIDKFKYEEADTLEKIKMKMQQKTKRKTAIGRLKQLKGIVQNSDEQQKQYYEKFDQMTPKNQQMQGKWHKKQDSLDFCFSYKSILKDEDSDESKEPTPTKPIQKAPRGGAFIQILRGSLNQPQFQSSKSIGTKTPLYSMNNITNSSKSSKLNSQSALEFQPTKLKPGRKSSYLISNKLRRKSCFCNKCGNLSTFQKQVVDLDKPIRSNNRYKYLHWFLRDFVEPKLEKKHHLNKMRVTKKKTHIRNTSRNPSYTKSNSSISSSVDLDNSSKRAKPNGKYLKKQPFSQFDLSSQQNNSYKNIKSNQNLSKKSIADTSRFEHRDSSKKPSIMISRNSSRMSSLISMSPSPKQRKPRQTIGQKQNTVILRQSQAKMNASSQKGILKWIANKHENKMDSSNQVAKTPVSHRPELNIVDFLYRYINKMNKKKTVVRRGAYKNTISLETYCQQRIEKANILTKIKQQQHEESLLREEKEEDEHDDTQSIVSEVPSDNLTNRTQSPLNYSRNLNFTQIKQQDVDKIKDFHKLQQQQKESKQKTPKNKEQQFSLTSRGKSRFYKVQQHNENNNNHTNTNKGTKQKAQKEEFRNSQTMDVLNFVRTRLSTNPKHIMALSPENQSPLEPLNLQQTDQVIDSQTKAKRDSFEQYYSQSTVGKTPKQLKEVAKKNLIYLSQQKNNAEKQNKLIFADLKSFNKTYSKGKNSNHISSYKNFTSNQSLNSLASPSHNNNNPHSTSFQSVSEYTNGPQKKRDKPIIDILITNQDQSFLKKTQKNYYLKVMSDQKSQKTHPDQIPLNHIPQNIDNTFHHHNNNYNTPHKIQSIYYLNNTVSASHGHGQQYKSSQKTLTQIDQKSNRSQGSSSQQKRKINHINNHNQISSPVKSCRKDSEGDNEINNIQMVLSDKTSENHPQYLNQQQNKLKKLLLNQNKNTVLNRPKENTSSQVLKTSYISQHPQRKLHSTHYNGAGSTGHNNNYIIRSSNKLKNNDISSSNNKKCESLLNTETSPRLNNKMSLQNSLNSYLLPKQSQQFKISSARLANYKPLQQNSQQQLQGNGSQQNNTLKEENSYLETRNTNRGHNVIVNKDSKM